MWSPCLLGWRKNFDSIVLLTLPPFFIFNQVNSVAPLPCGKNPDSVLATISNYSPAFKSSHIYKELKSFKVFISRLSHRLIAGHLKRKYCKLHVTYPLATSYCPVVAYLLTHQLQKWPLFDTQNTEFPLFNLSRK